MGGQAVMDGVMMRGSDRMAVAVRIPDGRIHIRTEALPGKRWWADIPIVRGIFAFFSSLVIGMKTLLYSADVLEAYGAYDESADASQNASGATASTASQNASGADEEAQPVGFEGWLTKKFGKRAAWNLMIYATVALSLVLTVVIFILLPTVAVNLLGKVTENVILLNLAEGVLRILIFIGYIVAIGNMEEIKTTFQYHGAEHKTIHCFENNLDLTPGNAQQFYTLHPRCGTSFLMFVMVISLILFSLLGWPNLVVRLLSRIVLIPLVAGLSYELLKWAGRSDSVVVKILSMPGLLLQKLTTREPSDSQLEVAICSVKAVMVPADAPFIEGICDKDANLIEARHIGD